MATEIRYAGFPSALVFESAKAKLEGAEAAAVGRLGHHYRQQTGRLHSGACPRLQRLHAHRRSSGRAPPGAGVRRHRAGRRLSDDYSGRQAARDRRRCGRQHAPLPAMALPRLPHAARLRGGHPVAFGSRSLRRVRRPVRPAQPVLQERLYERIHGAEDRQRYRDPRSARRAQRREVHHQPGHRPRVPGQLPVRPGELQGQEIPDDAQGGARRGEVRQFQDAVGGGSLRPGIRARARTTSSSSSWDPSRRMWAA